MLRQELLHCAQLGDSSLGTANVNQLNVYCHRCCVGAVIAVQLAVLRLLLTYGWDHIVTDVVLILQLTYARAFHSSLVGLCFSSARTGSTPLKAHKFAELEAQGLSRLTRLMRTFRCTLVLHWCQEITLCILLSYCQNCYSQLHIILLRGFCPHPRHLPETQKHLIPVPGSDRVALSEMQISAQATHPQGFGFPCAGSWRNGSCTQG